MFDYLINTKAKSNANGETYEEHANKKDIRGIALYGYIKDFSYNKIISNLREKDFERTLSIINKLNQPKNRIFYKLNLLERRNLYGSILEIERFCSP